MTTPQAWYDHAALAVARSLGRPCPHPPSYRAPATVQVKRGDQPWTMESGTACRACGYLLTLDAGWPTNPEGAWVDAWDPAP